MSSGNSRFGKIATRKKHVEGTASDKAFKLLGLWKRSAEKFDGGLRTLVKHCKDEQSKKIYEWAHSVCKDDEFLFSTYCGGEFSVITTKQDQWAYMTDDTPYCETTKVAHEEISVPFVHVIDKQEVGE